MANSKTSVSPTKVVNGTAGNDILKVPAGTQVVNGGGGTDTVSLGTYQYYANYQIARNADGSISVTDVHGGTLSNTKMVGVSTLQFTDGSYNVTTGKFIPGTPAVVAPPPVVSPPPPVVPIKVVNGTSGNDTLTVPAGTQVVNGDGGVDTVSLGPYQYYASYQIVRNTDGSVSVTDVHGGSLTNAKMVGIATLQFTDGVYQVGTGQFISSAKIVNGTAGNDTLTLPVGTQLVNGDGGTDTVALGANQYFAGYQIVRNADGSIAVTDAHGGSITNAQMVGIATLQFTDGSYNVATGQFTSNVPVVVTPPPVIKPVTGVPPIDPTKVVNGTTGNDTLSVPAGTQQVNGDGGTDTVAFGPYQYFASYQITRNADGSIAVTDVHGGSITNAQMVGIATLQFTDGSYNVATGQFTSGAATVPPPPVTPPPVIPPTIDPTKIVNGTTGNDTLSVPAGTLLVNGDGGTDTVAFGPYQYFASYQITRNADGSIAVTDVHGGSITHTQMVGIATLQFTDGSYNVATGQFTSGAATVPPPPVTTPPVVPPTIDPTKIVNGTTGNDTLSVPAGTLLVNGDGGTDTVAFGPYQSFGGYQITRNADGSIDVTDVHGGSITHTQMVGITTLQFTDGSYNVATGQFTSGTAPPPVTTPPVTTPPVVPPTIDPTKIVNGTTGNDTLSVPAGTLLVNGDGGTDTVAFGAYQYFGGYQITRNADGSIDVTDVHGGSITHTQMVGIATLQFTDGSYNVATGQFTSGAGTPPPTGGTTPPPSGGGSGNLIAPTVATPQHASDIVAVQIENNGSTALPSRVITFGQTFADGDVPSGSHLVATINGQQVALQMDVKVTNLDGSVAEAILSVQAPALAANGAVDIMLSRGAASDGTAIDPHGFAAAGYDEQVSLTFHNADGSTSTNHIDVGAALTQALAAGTAQTWLSGSLASEVRIDVPINGSLTAQFDVRANADGTFVTDVAMLNNVISSTASKTYNYDIAITSHGQALVNQSNVQQAPMQNWEQVVWSSAQGVAQAPADHLVYDVAYLEKTGAVAGYDTSTGLSAAALASQAAALASANTGPLGAGLVMQYEPTTGARPDIGPTTQWGADWLVSQNQTAEQIMLANANASSAIPIHAANADGSLFTPANNPNFWLDSRDATGTETVNFGTIESETGWTPDSAHMPDLTYLAALTTGSRYALDQLQAQADFDLLSIAPGFRADNSVLIGEQERGIAWTIRDVANAAYLTPDGDPLKAYFTGQVNALIQNLDTNYVHGALGAAEGQLQGYVMGAWDTNQVAPWQQGYLVIALGQAAAEGFSGAAEVLGWMNNFVSGLYLNGANGYNPLDGSGYWLTTGTGDVQSNTFQSFTTWQQLFDANFSGQAAPTSLFGFPDDSIGGYSTIAKAALATEWNVTHAAQDLAAYAYVTQHTPFLIQDPSGYAASQTWDITPTLLNGHHLQNNEVYYGNGGTTTATTADGLLAAASGNNLLQAGSSDSILIGGSGSDTLYGGAGNDYLFAGTGAQTLYGAGGTNYLEGHLNGGTGVDLFHFNVTDTAHDIVVNFKPGFDTLDITGGGSGVTALQLLASATTDSAGDAVLHLSGQHDVVLQGIHVAQLDSHSVHVG